MTEPPPPPAGSTKDGGDDASEQRAGATAAATAGQPGDAPADTASAAADRSVGAAQRLRLFVPTENTTLVLGHKGTDIGFAGISGITDGHVYITSQAATGTLQSHGQMLIQSTTDEMYVIATKNAVFGSAAQAYVSGKGGVVIAGGLGPSPAPVETTGTTPTRELLHDLSEVNEQINSGIGSQEKVIGVVTGVATMLASDLTMPGLIGGLTGAAGVIAALVGGGEGTGVAIHGASAATMTSGATALMFGKTGAAVISDFKAELIGAVAAEVAGLGSAKLVGGLKAAVEAGNKAEVLAGRSVEIASRFGTTEVLGKEVEIGSKTPPPPQTPTLEVKVGALKKIEMAASYTVELKLDAEEEVAKIESEGTIDLKAANRIELESKSDVVIKVGDYSITVKTSGITIGKGTDPSLQIEQNGDIHLTSNQNGVQIVKSSCVRVKQGGVSLELGNSGATLTAGGKPIKLG